MTFTPEDGTGLDDANSYASVALADAYFAERGISAWTGSNTVKEQALVRATDYIEKRFGGRFRGRKSTQEQALAWPRTGAYTRDGYPLEEVPVLLARATAEYALRALTDTLMPDPTTDASGRVVTRKREKVGPIEEETQYAEGSALDAIIKPYPAADALLRDLVVPGGTSVRA